MRWFYGKNKMGRYRDFYKEYPELPLPEGSSKINPPKNIFISSLIYGIIPFLIVAACFLLKLLIFKERPINPPFVILGILSPMPDYMNVCLILKQVPKGSMIQCTNEAMYWYI